MKKASAKPTKKIPASRRAKPVAPISSHPTFAFRSASFSLNEAVNFGLAFARRRELLKIGMAYYAFFAVAALVLVAGFALHSFTGLLAGKVGIESFAASLGGLGFAGLFLFGLFAVTGLFVNAFMASSAAQLLRYRVSSIEQARVQAFGRFRPVLGVAILSGLASFAVSLVVDATGTAGGKALASVINFAASLFLSMAFLYAPFDAVINNRGALDAVKASFSRFSRRSLTTLAFLLAELAVFIASALAAVIVGGFALLLAVAGFGVLGASLPALLIALVLCVAAFAFLLACLAFASQFSIGLLSYAVESGA
jgi:hypothetical protein